jgi:hypothetical protein
VPAILERLTENRSFRERFERHAACCPECMVSTRVGCGALLFLAMAALGSACAPAYYAEYALAEGAPTESVQCYDSCMRSTLAEFRQACFAHCDGVVATKTAKPCEQAGRERCTWQALAQPSEPEAAEEYAEASDATVAAAVIGSIFDVLIFAATSPPARTERRERHVHVHEPPKRPAPRIPARPERASARDRADHSKDRGSAR